LRLTGAIDLILDNFAKSTGFREASAWHNPTGAVDRATTPMKTTLIAADGAGANEEKMGSPYLGHLACLETETHPVQVQSTCQLALTTIGRPSERRHHISMWRPRLLRYKSIGLDIALETFKSVAPMQLDYNIFGAS
jgi:hypothetical protein